MILDINKKLEGMGFILLYENENGFSFLKKIGQGVVLNVTASHTINHEFKLMVYDPAMPDYKAHGYCAMGLTENEMRAFTVKMKDWRKKYEERT